MKDTWTFNPQPIRPDWGVFAPALKLMSTRRPIREAPLPPEVTISLGPSAGVRTLPLVHPGERVLTGQPIVRKRC